MDPLLAGVDLCDRRLAIDQGRAAVEAADIRLLEERADAAAKSPHDPVLPGDGFRMVVLRRPDRKSDRLQRARFAERMGRVGSVDQRLRGNAADVQAGAAELPILDQHRVEAKLARANGADIAARAAADDEDLALEFAHDGLAAPSDASWGAKFCSRSNVFKSLSVKKCNFRGISARTLRGRVTPIEAQASVR